ncbi:MAG: M24 family metallopeptidase [Candidatus Polarisedimenticolia bacterium]
MDKARELMAGHKVSHLIAVPGPDMFYLTGLPLRRADRFSALALHATAAPILLCPVMDRGLVQAGPGAVEDVRYFDDSEDPITLMSKHLKKTDASFVALSGQTWYEEFVPLHADLPKITFAAAHPYVGIPRQVKSIEEIQLIRSVARLVQGAVDAALAELREGMRESEVALRVESWLRERGAVAEGTVQSGPRTESPRLPAGDRRIANGDLVVVSYGASVHGYWARVSRTAVLGKATGRMKMIHQALRDAQDFAQERVKPDLPPAAIDQVARAALGKRGFIKLLLHSAGNGCGVEPVEAPYISPGYFTRLAAGNVFTLGQGVYTSGEYGIRLEDMAQVTPDGAKWMTAPPAGLLEL